MIDPKGVGDSLGSLVQKLDVLAKENEKLDFKSSITNEGIKSSIQTLKSIQEGLSIGYYDDLQESDQKKWEKKMHSVEKSVDKTLEWMNDPTQSFFNCWTSKSQSEELDDLLQGVKSGLDDFNQFSINKLQNKEYLLNQGNQQIHRRIEGPGQELVTHKVREEVPINDDLNQLFTIIKAKYLKNSHIRRLINPEHSFPIEESYINLVITNKKGMKKKDENQESRNTINSKNGNERRIKEGISTFEQIYGRKTKIEVEKIFQECKGTVKKALILGRAGIGKSTFCQYVTYRWAKGNLWKEFTLVVLIRLRSLTEDVHFKTSDSYVDLLSKVYPEAGNLNPEQKHKFQLHCEKGEILWILDGYDEVIDRIPDNFGDLFRKLSTSQPHLLTSRPTNVPTKYETKLEIIGFLDENIDNFVETFFNIHHSPSIASDSKLDQFSELLRANPTIWGIAHIPINLELICSPIQDESMLNSSLSSVTDLYESLIDWLCHRYLIKRGEIKEEDHDRSKASQMCEPQLEIMRSLAFAAIQKKTIIFTIKVLEKSSRVVKLKTDDDMMQVIEFGLIQSVDDQTSTQPGIVSRQYQFVHLSFQEFFAARHLLFLLSSEDTCDQAIEFIHNHKYEPRFSLMFTFAAGLSHRPQYQTPMIRSRCQESDHLLRKELVSTAELFWCAIESEPLDLIGLRHILVLMGCIDEYGAYPSIRESKYYQNEIEAWMEYCTAQRSTVTTEHLSELMERTWFLPNQEFLQKKLVTLLKTQNKFVKLNVLHICAALRISSSCPDYCNILLEVLQDNSYDDCEPQRIACEALSKLGSQVVTHKVIDALLKMAQKGRIKVAAFDALVQLVGERNGTDDVITMLLKATNDADHDRQRSARRALLRIASTATVQKSYDILMHLMKCDDRDIVNSSRRILMRLGGQQWSKQHVIRAVVSSARELDHQKKAQTYRNLLKLDSQTSAGTLVRALLGDSPDTHLAFHNYTCDELLERGERLVNVNKIKKLIEEIATSPARKQECCGVPTSHVSIPDQEVLVKSRLPMLSNQDPSAVIEACQTLVKIGKVAATSEVFSNLIHLTRHDDVHLGIAACEALGSFSESISTVFLIQNIPEIIGYNDKALKWGKCEALKAKVVNLPMMETIERLTEVIRDKNPQRRRTAINVLVKIAHTLSPRMMMTTIEKFVHQKSVADRKLVAEAICNIIPSESLENALETLYKAFNSDHDLGFDSASKLFRKLVEIAMKRNRREVLTIALGTEYAHERKSAYKKLHGLNVYYFQIMDLLKESDREQQLEALGMLQQREAFVSKRDIVDMMVEIINHGSKDQHLLVCEAFLALTNKAMIDSVINSLVDAMGSDDALVREAVCGALGHLGKSAAVENVMIALTQGVEDKCAGVKRTACQSLASMGYQCDINFVIDALIRATRDQDSSVRSESCKTLGIVAKKRKDGDHIKALIKSINDPEPEVQLAACEALQEIDYEKETDNVINVLVSLYDYRNIDIQNGVLRILGNMGRKAATKEVMKVLEEAMHHKDLKIKKNAFKTIGKMGLTTLKNENIIGMVLNKAKDEKSHIHGVAWDTLTSLVRTTTDDHLIKLLLDFLKSPQVDLKYRACKAIGQTPADKIDTSIISDLMKIIQSEEDRRVLSAVSKTIYHIFMKSGSVKMLVNQVGKNTIDDLIAALSEIAQRYDQDIRRNALRAIGIMITEAVSRDFIDLCIKSIDDPDEELQMAVSETLSKLSHDIGSDSVIEALIEATRHSNINRICRAWETFAMMGQAACKASIIQALLEAIEDYHERVGIAACEAFLEMNERRINSQMKSILLEAIKDQNVHIRRGACRAMAILAERIADDDTINSLVETLANEDWVTRKLAHEALGYMGTKANQRAVIRKLLANMTDHNQCIADGVLKAVAEMCESDSTHDLIAELVEAIHLGDDQLKQRICQAFEKIGPRAASDDAIKVLIDMIVRTNEKILESAYQAIAAITNMQTYEKIIQAIFHRLKSSIKDSWDRFKRVLEKIEPKAASDDVREALIYAIVNGNDSVHESARQATAAIAGLQNTEKITEAISDEVKENIKDSWEKLKQILSLTFEKQISSMTIKQSTQMMFDDNFELRMLGCQILKLIGKKAAVEEVKQRMPDLLHDDNPLIRQQACEIVFGVGKQLLTKRIIIELLKNTKYELDFVRKAALKALSILDGVALTENMTDAIANGLFDTSISVLISTCETIEKLSERAATAKIIVRLVQLTASSDHRVCIASCKALGALGRFATSIHVEQALLKVLRKQNSDVAIVEAVCTALEKTAHRNRKNGIVNELVRVANSQNKTDITDKLFETMSNLGPIDSTSDLICLFKGRLQSEVTYHPIITFLQIIDPPDDSEVYLSLFKLTIHNDIFISATAKLSIDRIIEKTERYIEVLTKAMGDEDCLVQQSARDTLVKIAENEATIVVIKALIEAVEAKNCRIRKNACVALGKMGEKIAMEGMVAALTKAMTDVDGNVRQSACAALGEMQEEAARKTVLEALTKAMVDNSENVRQSACTVLGNLGEKAATKATIRALSKALTDAEAKVRRSACVALGKMGKKAVTEDVIAALTKAMKDEDDNVRQCACATRREMVADAATELVTETFIEAAGDEKSDGRQNALHLLVETQNEPTVKAVIEALMKAMGDHYKDIRQTACNLLKNVKEKMARKEVIEAFTKAMGDDRWEVRENACGVLVSMAENSFKEEIIEALTKAIGNENWRIRQSACHVLTDMKEKAATEKVIEALARTIRDENWSVRQSACDALKNMKAKAATKEVIEALTKGILDDKMDVRQSACSTLGMMGEKAATKEVIEALTKAMRDPDGSVRRNACEALGNMREKAATEIVIKVLTEKMADGKWEVRQSACVALSKMAENAATTEVIEALTKGIADEKWDVRQSACSALGTMGEKAATKEVIEALTKAMRDPDGSVRLHACEVLTSIGEKTATKLVTEGRANAMGAQKCNDAPSVCEIRKKMKDYVETEESIVSFNNAIWNANQDTRQIPLSPLGQVKEVATSKEMIERLIREIGGEHKIGERSALAALRAVSEHLSLEQLVLCVSLGTSMSVHVEGLWDLLVRQRVVLDMTERLILKLSWLMRNDQSFQAVDVQWMEQIGCQISANCQAWSCIIWYIGLTQGIGVIQRGGSLTWFSSSGPKNIVFLNARIGREVCRSLRVRQMHEVKHVICDSAQSFFCTIG